MHLLFRNRIIRTSLVVLVLSFLFTVAFLQATVAFAQEPSQECNGLDIVCLIDQSRSMKYRDQNGLRSNGVRTVIDILGDNAVYFCPGIQHRIAVLGYGDQSQENTESEQESTETEIIPSEIVTYITPTVIAPSLEALEDWNTQKRELKATIPIIDDLGGTDHESALRVAAQILHDWQSEPIGDEPRKRAVMLITDSEPCVADEGCVPDDYTFDRKAYMQRLESLTNTLSEDFPWRGADNAASVHIWLVGFRPPEGGYDPFDDPTVRPSWDRITQGHGGDVLPLQREDPDTMNANLTSVVADTLNPLLGSRLKSWDCREPIWVDPYLSNVTIIHIFRRGANPGVSLDDVVVRIKATRGDTIMAEFSRGKAVEGRGRIDDYTQDGPNERYVFFMPPPGKYLVEVQGADICEDLDVRIGQSGIRAEILEPTPDTVFSEMDEPPYYDTGYPTLFRVQLVQQTQREKVEPFQEDPDFRLDVHVTVRSQDDVAKPVVDPYNMEPVDKAQALYESRDPDTLNPLYIRTPYPGDYTWELLGTTRNPREFDTTSPITTPIVALQVQGSFTAMPVERFGFSILEPVQDDVVLANDVKQGKPVPVPLQVSIQLTDTMGNALSPERVLADETADMFEVRLLDQNGRLLETDRLHYAPGSPVFSTQMRTLSSSQTPDPPGEYRLEVDLLVNYVRGKFRPLTASQSVTFRRERARGFDFATLRPSEGEEFSLVEGVAKGPLQVEVQILDENDKPLSSDLSISDPEATPLRASLLNEKDEVLDTQLMRLKGENDNVYVTELGSGGTDPNRYDPGCYRITVELMDDYRSQVFRPKRQITAPRNICLSLVRKFNWDIVQPVTRTYTIHPALRWFPPPEPLPLVVRMESKDGRPLGASDVLRPGAETLFVGRLYEPGRETPYDLTLRAGGSSGEFVADWPREADTKGDYVLEVLLSKDSLSVAWIPISDEPQRQPFQRQDTLLTMPWALLALIILTAIVVVANVLIYLATGPLFGVMLAFTKER